MSTNPCCVRCRVKPDDRRQADNLIEIDHVGFGYDASRPILDDLTLSFERGKVTTLLGGSGCGKTTLLRMLATATVPTAGELKVFGKDARAERTAIRSEVALLSHASFIYEDLSAEQNLNLVARLLGIENAAKAVPALLERVGLKERSDHAVRQFSAGMRKRLAIARLLLKAPKLALLDEPFGELDPVGINQMEALIGELQTSGTTIVLATHLVEQGQRLTQVRLHLENGRKTEPT